MSSKESKPKLVGPWRNLHAAVWLIGLAILAWQGWWWPGILVLVAVSLLLEGALQQFAPHAFADAAPLAAPVSPLPPVPAPEAAPQAHRMELLPATCPNCTGPIRGHEVKWTGPQSADCPYCGTNLPLQSAAGPRAN